jgi:hypothetical protein
MSNEPELGQIMFGNPTGDYGTTEYVDSLIDYLLNEIERIYWNENQSEWNRHDNPDFKGIEFRPYIWDEESEEAKKPNLKFDFSSQEIRWYKHPGRGQSCSEKWSERKWREWFDEALKVIRSNEKDL